MNANVILNNEKNGIEIRFESKPDMKTIDTLKSLNFRWSPKQKMWYAKQTDERLAFVNNMNDEDITFALFKNKTEKSCKYDLWEVTRTNTIDCNYTLYKIHDTKEIAALVRKHIKPRFPMCKFSVKSDYNSIDVDLLSSPFEKDSEELKAIVHYVYAYVESYNYDNSDYMSDYYDVNFYFSSERNIVSYRYEQTVSNEDIESMIAEFRTKKADFEQAEAIRKEQEYQEYLKQMEIDRKIATERLKKIEADKKAIEDGVVVADCENPYYILDLRSPYLNKLCTIDEANKEIEKGEFKTEVCQVVREVNMSAKLYEKFKNMLLCDFSFLEGMGGTATLDNRINEMMDYTKMSEEEKETVEFYACDCVAIYCEDKLMLVCNPEGYDYARYILIPGESYTTTNNYSVKQLVSDEELAVNREVFERLYDKSTDIIMINNLCNDWNSSKFCEWRRHITRYIIENRISLNKDIVRAIPEDAIEFKEAMYRVLEEPENIKDQFDEAEFNEGQKITVIRFDSILGGVRANQVTYKRYEFTDWGGKEGIKLIFTMPHKRGEFYQILNDECLIVNDWIEIPRGLFWEEVKSSTGLLCEKTKYSSFDLKQYDVVLDYLKSIGIKSIINTYKPQFN